MLQYEHVAREVFYGQREQGGELDGMFVERSCFAGALSGGCVFAGAVDGERPSSGTNGVGEPSGTGLCVCGGGRADCCEAVSVCDTAVSGIEYGCLSFGCDSGWDCGVA